MLCASIPKNNAKTKSMTKTFKIIFLSIIIGFTIQTRAQNVFSSDVDNFWKAYDKITKTKDSILQKKLLEDLYFSKGTEGLKAIRKARNYTSQDYINAINNYPKFWNSVRKNTLKSKRYQRDLNLGIEKLRKIYPLRRLDSINFLLRNHQEYSFLLSLHCRSFLLWLIRQRSYKNFADVQFPPM